jgi:hypothetical protein
MKTASMIAATLMLLTSGASALAQQANSYANCIAEARPVFGSTMTIENLRQYMKDHPTCATAAGAPVEYPAPAQPAPCSVAVFGIKGCKELEQLQVDIESTRPCVEMSKRGMQAEADRCFNKTRELDRDARDRIRFQRGQ